LRCSSRAGSSFLIITLPKLPFERGLIYKLILIIMGHEEIIRFGF